MRRSALALALASGAALVPTAAAALDIVERVFQVTYVHEGTEYVLHDAYVPLLPGNACYAWFLRARQADTPVRIVERMTLPQAIDWGTTGQSPDDATQIEEAGRVAVTTLDAGTDAAGWLSHGWCVAEGDPTGTHLIEVAADGDVVGTFSFEVLAAGDYRFPEGATYPDRATRSADDTW